MKENERKEPADMQHIPHAPVLTAAQRQRRQEGRKRRRRRSIRNGILTFLVLVLLIAGLVLLLRSCSAERRIIGTWDYDTVTVYRFDPDGRGTLLLPSNGYAFSYRTEKDLLFIDFEDGNVIDHTYTFSVNGRKLTLTAKESAETVYVLTKK